MLRILVDILLRIDSRYGFFELWCNETVQGPFVLSTFTSPVLLLLSLIARGVAHRRDQFDVAICTCHLTPLPPCRRTRRTKVRRLSTETLTKMRHGTPMYYNSTCAAANPSGVMRTVITDPSRSFCSIHFSIVASTSSPAPQ